MAILFGYRWYGESEIYSRIALINGIRTHYDACSSSRHSYDEKKFKYIGCGDFHKINEVVQKGKPCIVHFFNRRS